MDILTGGQMRRVDRHAIEELGIPGLDLMEAAGAGVATALREDFPDLADRPLLVLCGKGNNGGDGLVAARVLKEQGFAPQVLLFAEPGDLKGDAAASYRAARERDVSILSLTDTDVLSDLEALQDKRTILLDCLLGTGIRGGVRGLLAKVVERINRSKAEVVAVDLPSGLDADSLAVTGEPVKADRTYTLCRPKLPLASDPAASFAGAWRVIPIGIPRRSVQSVHPKFQWLTDSVASYLPARHPGAHKGTFGHLLAVTGSRGKGGASVLLGRAALRTGTGLCTLAVPASLRPEVAVQQPELMTEPLPEDAGGRLNREAVGAVLSLAQRKQALAVGPGLGAGGELTGMILDLAGSCLLPLVLDADGLNALSRSRKGAEELKDRKATTILTPHPKEAARLLQEEVPTILADRLAAARELSDRSGSIVVLKGKNTIMAEPSGRTAFNSTGNPGMATAGTGDALTGMIGGFLACGLDSWPAAVLGVYVHGAAGDIAAEKVGGDGMIASDLIQAIPRAIRNLRREEGTT